MLVANAVLAAGSSQRALTGASEPTLHPRDLDARRSHRHACRQVRAPYRTARRPAARDNVSNTAVRRKNVRGFSVGSAPADAGDVGELKAVVSRGRVAGQAGAAAARADVGPARRGVHLRCVAAVSGAQVSRAERRAQRRGARQERVCTRARQRSQPPPAQLLRLGRHAERRGHQASTARLTA